MADETRIRDIGWTGTPPTAEELEVSRKHWDAVRVAREAEEVATADAYIAIVRELAERGPYIHVDYDHDMMLCTQCALTDSADVMKDPANHEPTCLWRRARELHPKP